jgi:hypothetical protein
MHGKFEGEIIMSKLLRLFLVLTVLLSSGLLLRSASASDPQPGTPGTKTYLPLVGAQAVTVVAAGAVKDENGNGLPGATIQDASGASTQTDASGAYSFQVAKGPNVLAVSKPGILFERSAQDVNATGPLQGQNFTACTNYVTNGGFETNPPLAWWEIRPYSTSSIYPVLYPAFVTNAAAHSGANSLFAGNNGGWANLRSYSDVRSPAIFIPSTATAAQVDLWVLQYTTESPVKPQPSGDLNAPDAADMQYVKVLDASNNTLEIIWFQRKNTAAWTPVTLDLMRWAGQSIKIDAGVYNDGADGVTWMFVDDVSFQICNPVVPPPPPPPPPPAPNCTEQFSNVNFEADNSWFIPSTEYSAGYSWDFYYSPWRSMRSGIYWQSQNRYSYSEFRQYFTIPYGGLSSANLTFYALRNSNEPGGFYGVTEKNRPLRADQIANLAPDSTSDMQYLLILDAYGYILKWIDFGKVNDPYWRYFNYDLTSALNQYRGQTVWIDWGTYNNGWSGVTSMYVDDAHMVTCIP